MIVDCIFVDVYIKDPETLALFQKAANKHGFTDIEIFDDKSDRFKYEWDA
jgi:hypothetical protein